MLSPIEQIAARLGVPVAQLQLLPPEPAQRVSAGIVGPSVVPTPADLFSGYGQRTPYTGQAEEKQAAVRRSPEFERILNLPRRPAPGPEQAETVELARQLTARFARHPDPYPVGRQYHKKNTGYLRPLQAAGLAEAWMCRGLLGPIRPGYGKLLLSYLLPVAVGAKRPLYLAPASLEKEVKREFTKYSQHWRGPHPQHFPFLSYQTLSAKNAGGKKDSQGQLLRAELLERFQPDLLIFDECHKLKNSDTVCQKRVRRYLQAHPDTIVCALSGTMTRRSLREFAHISKWALRDKSPLPTTYADLEAWADALDDADALGPRTGLGALMQFCTAEDLAKIEVARGTFDAEETIRGVVRGAVRRRMVETPGVIATQDGPLDVPLDIMCWEPSRTDPAVDEAFTTLRALWETPAGMPIADGLELARHAKTLGLGFFQHWSPPPPDEWLNARREWASFCRNYLTHNRRDIDSEAQVKDAVRAGGCKDGGLLAAWEEQAPKYDPEAHAKTEWVSTEAIDSVREWLAERQGIIWVDSIALGLRLEAELGVPYYGAEGMSKSGKFILDHKPGVAMIASKSANGTGRHLVAWEHNLWLTCPEEQSLARTHRPGTNAEVVTNHVYAGCREHIAAYWKATQAARYAQQVTGQAQRLVYASVDMPALDDVESRATPRWCR